jgi:hypothetical protein
LAAKKTNLSVEKNNCSAKSPRFAKALGAGFSMANVRGQGQGPPSRPPRASNRAASFVLPRRIHRAADLPSRGWSPRRLARRIFLFLTSWFWREVGRTGALGHMKLCHIIGYECHSCTCSISREIAAHQTSHQLCLSISHFSNPMGPRLPIDAIPCMSLDRARRCSHACP